MVIATKLDPFSSVPTARTTIPAGYHTHVHNKAVGWKASLDWWNQVLITQRVYLWILCSANPVFPCVVSPTSGYVLDRTCNDQPVAPPFHQKIQVNPTRLERSTPFTSNHFLISTKPRPFSTSNIYLERKKGKTYLCSPFLIISLRQINIIPFINHGHFEIKTLPLITDNSGLFLSFNQNMQLWGGSIKIRKVGSLLTGGGNQ